MSAESPSEPASETVTSRVGVLRARGAYCVVAVEDIAQGEAILRLTGSISDRPSRGSLQVGTHEHLEVPPGLRLERTIDEHPWRFMNHGCEPNAMVHGRDIVALEAIPAGTEVTYNYNATEYDMKDVFACECGATTCAGEDVRGFRYLSADEQARLRPQLSPHLLRRLDGET